MPAFVLSAAAPARVVYVSSADDDHVLVRNSGPTNPAEVSKESTLVAGQGITLAPGAEERIDVQMGEQLYALSTAGTTVIVE
jgi:hypothetical protein